jgi:CRP-like cAMP-binding protein
MPWVDILGYAASLAVLVTFCMSTMIPLRIVALVSNVLFCAYGYFDHLYPVLILHAVLFPVNVLRLVQFQRLVRDVRDAHREDLPIQSLLPYMVQQSLAAGETLIRKGDKADRLYFLVEGTLEIVEFGKMLEAGAVLGEIGVFARDQARTATVVARSDCRLYALSESKAKQLFFQDKSFGFAVMQLIINRLLENNRQLQERAAA